MAQLQVKNFEKGIKDMMSLRNSNAAAQRHFDVLREFKKLDHSRKISLFDNIVTNNTRSFENTVNIIWSDATKRDAKKLERFILRSLASNDQ